MASRLLSLSYGSKSMSPYIPRAIDAAAASGAVMFYEGLSLRSPDNVKLFAAGTLQGMAGAALVAPFGATLGAKTGSEMAAHAGGALAAGAGAAALGYALGSVGAMPYRPAFVVGALAYAAPVLYDMATGAASLAEGDDAAKVKSMTAG